MCLYLYSPKKLFSPLSFLLSLPSCLSPCLSSQTFWGVCLRPNCFTIITATLLLEGVTLINGFCLYSHFCSCSEASAGFNHSSSFHSILESVFRLQLRCWSRFSHLKVWVGLEDLLTGLTYVAVGWRPPNCSMCRNFPQHADLSIGLLGCPHNMAGDFT